MPFKSEDRVKALLWCDRHCCLCGKQCAANIELHHIQPTRKQGRDELNNAIPLCFDCHCVVGHYEEGHPRGSKLSALELERRRDQMYERHTARYVPPVLVELSQSDIDLPKVRFTIKHCANINPVVAFVTLRASGCKKPIDSEYYDGTRGWNLNPLTAICGHFLLPEAALRLEKPSVTIEISLEDALQRPHQLLPFGYSLLPDRTSWYLEPSPEALPARTRLRN